MQIQTTRFGVVAVEKSDLITLTEGLLGFNDLKTFVILEDPDDLIFAWLQSCEKPAVAFPILEPELFSADYKVRLTKADRESIGLDSSAAETQRADFKIFTIVTIPNDVMQMTANLKAPIALNVGKRLAKQVVTQDNDHPIKHPIFNELQQRLVTGAGAVAASGPKLSKPAISVKVQSTQVTEPPRPLSVAKPEHLI